MEKRLVILCFLGDPSIPAASGPNSGGFNADTAELVELVAGTEYHVDIITNTSPQKSTVLETLQAPNVTLHRIPVPHEALYDQNQLSVLFPNVLNQVRRVWNQFDTPPFLIHSLYWFSGYLAMHLSHIYCVPFVHSIVSLSAEKTNSGRRPRFQAQREWEDVFLSHAAEILSISEAEAELLHTEYMLPKEKIRVVGRGIPEDLVLSHNETGVTGTALNVTDVSLPTTARWWNSGAFTYIGRMTADKGIGEIVQAWLRLQQDFDDDTPPLWLVGGTPAEIKSVREPLMKQFPLLAEQEQSLHVCWWGYLNAGAISTVLMKSLALVNHSRFEAGGRVILEALSTKTPVIATPYGFAKDFIRDWENGFLVNFGDIALLELRMSHFARLPLLSNALGNNAYQTYQKKHDEWTFGKTHLDIYRSYSEGVSCKKRSPPTWAEDTDDFFKKGIITSYPYTGIPTPNLLRTLRGRFQKTPDKAVQVSNPDGCSFLSLADNRWYIKQMYSAINKANLWNPAGLIEAVTVQRRFQRACLSAHSSYVLTPFYTDAGHHLIVTEKLPVVPNTQIDRNIQTVSQTLAAFSKSIVCAETSAIEKQFGGLDSFSSKCANTLTGYWQELFHAMEQAPPGTDTPQVDQQLADHYSHLAGESPSQSGVNYGKTVYGHLLQKEGRYFLLPSSDSFWGELGWDAGVLGADWLLRHNELADLETIQLLHAIAAPWGLTPNQTLSWLLLQLVIRDFSACVCRTAGTQSHTRTWIARLAGLDM